jgi:hypothetical protein
MASWPYLQHQAPAAASACGSNVAPFFQPSWVAVEKKWPFFVLGKGFEQRNEAITLKCEEVISWNPKRFFMCY